jgi:copper(I)-binding protein
MNLKRVLALVALAWALPVAADVSIADAWIRGTVPGQKVTGAFMQVASTTDTSLIDVSSPSAKFVEIHQMTKEGSVMKMRAVDRLPIPAGKPVELTPAGYHMMLFELKAPLNAGDVIPLTLTFEDKSGKKSTVEVKAMVRALTTGAAPPKP